VNRTLRVTVPVVRFDRQAVTFSYLGLLASIVLAATPLAAQQYHPPMTGIDGDEIIAVFITSSGCVASRQPELPGSLESIKLALAERGRAQAFRFSIIGVALDWDPMTGVEHLGAFGRFDELVAGRNWWNSGAAAYIWRDVPGSAVTPQLVVVRRTSQLQPGGIRISREEPFLRLLGTREIMEWADAGSPLPAREPRDADGERR
jgi:hypothetical protein